MTAILWFFWGGFEETSGVALVVGPPVCVAGSIFLPGLRVGAVYLPGAQAGKVIES